MTPEHPTSDDACPLRCILYGESFAALDDAEGCGFSASGPNSFATLAGRLLQAGFDPDRPLILFRGGERLGKLTLAAAAAQPNRSFTLTTRNEKRAALLAAFESFVAADPGEMAALLLRVNTERGVALLGALREYMAASES